MSKINTQKHVKKNAGKNENFRCARTVRNEKSYFFLKIPATLLLIVKKCAKHCDNEKRLNFYVVYSFFFKPFRSMKKLSDKFAVKKNFVYIVFSCLVLSKIVKVRIMNYF